MSRSTSSLLAVLCAILLIAPFAAQAGGDEVVLVFNTRVAESKSVAQHYAELRHVPHAQTLGFDLPDTETISRADFEEHLQKPLLQALLDRRLFRLGTLTGRGLNGTTQVLSNVVVSSRVRYLVLCYGVPLRILQDDSLVENETEKIPAPLRVNGAAVDSELSCLPQFRRRYNLTGPLVNPFFGVTNSALLSPTNGVFMTARLDGPTALIARNLVDKAIAAETNGLWGRAYVDMRGLKDGPYLEGDQWMAEAASAARRNGFDTIVDDHAGTFPASFPLSQVALYAGWYDESASGPFTQPNVEFMPGAVAYHLHSFSAATLRSTTQHWVGPLLAKGATATLGCVAEPFLTGTPQIGLIFSRLLEFGFTFGEAAYAGQHYLSWQTTVVGDPLYRPFGIGLMERESLLTRSHQTNLLAWAAVREANLQLLRGQSRDKVAEEMEDLPWSRQNAVVWEKLADLYQAEGKPYSTTYALQHALESNPSPVQRQRLILELAPRLADAGRNTEAFALYKEFLNRYPDYPEQEAMYRQLETLADKLGRSDEAAEYGHEANRLRFALPSHP